MKILPNIVFCNLKTVLRKHVRGKHSNSSGRWQSVVGLEVHAQIQSNTKLFSGASYDFASPVNTSVSLFDAAIPGTLPVLNESCVKAGIKTALALSCNINPVSLFDRKHYFYADLPAGYQITQQRAPLAINGNLSFPVYWPGVTKKPYKKTSRLQQLQLEQDSGKSLHDPDMKMSLLDLNRAGVALMELVFLPDLTNGYEAASLVKELILILHRLDTCSCKMEEGALRVDANVSIHKKGDPYGIRTEVKNIGSVRSVAQAVNYEIERQIKAVSAGEKITNETRSWDAVEKRTVLMRDKEVQTDYRFMPEPNLLPLHVNVDGKENQCLINVKELAAQIPVLPDETRQNLVQQYGINEDTAIILVNDDGLFRYFTEIMSKSTNISPKTVCNILINDLLAVCNKKKIELSDCKIKPSYLQELIQLLADEKINLFLAKLILDEMFVNTELTPIQISKENDWFVISDKIYLTKICKEVISRNEKLVIQYQGGKQKALYAFAGEVLKETDNKANMALSVDILTELLKK